MALATKCPHCSTIFRVAHDQLKLRGGIVRCGACNEVFDGNAALVEPALKQAVIIDIPASPLAAPTTSPELDALITTLAARHTDAPGEESTLAVEVEAEAETEAGEAAAVDETFDLDLDVDLDLDSEPAPSGTEAAGPQRPAYPPLSALDDEDAPALPAPALPAPDDHDGRREPALEQPDEHLTAVALHDSFELDAYPQQGGDARHEDGQEGQHQHKHEDENEHENEHEDVVTLSGAAKGGSGVESTALAAGGDDRDGNGAATAPATPVSAGLADAEDEPGFVKRDRRRRQFGKAARIGMALGIPLLLAALAAQTVGTFRNQLAAAVPALKPALVSACALAGCKVDLPAQIDALSIEQGELQTLADKVFSFSTTLRNQSRSAQAWPHMELILNDAADKPVLRRVFAPRDYLANPADLAKGFGPRSEQSVKLHFELGQVKASGYHIAVFYP